MFSRKIIPMLMACAALSFPLAHGAIAEEAAVPSGRTALDLLGEINQMRSTKPTYSDKLSLEENRERAMQYLRERNLKISELILQLYQMQPTAPQMPNLLDFRWRTLTSSGQTDLLMSETEEYLKRFPTQNSSSLAMMYHNSFDLKKAKNAEERRDIVDAYEKRFGKIKDYAEVVSNAYMSAPGDDEKEVYASILLKEFPAHPTARHIQLEQIQNDKVGKPFELAFTDALSGKNISMETLKGKVLVIDFWATWCGPCVKDFPNMKKIYAEYKDKGVEFIGVNLDDPNQLETVRQFAAANGLSWPQFYQGKGWDSPFSKSWGINSIPRVFVVDAEGNLADIKARGKLETLLPELLKKAERKVTAN